VLTRENRGVFLAVYIARVRITVNVGGSTIVREGHGTGEGRGPTPGEVHDTALKGAETDATKRALATFGKPFGLSLYEHGKFPAPIKASIPTPSRVETGRAVSFECGDLLGLGGQPISSFNDLSHVAPVARRYVK
jgi:hypothetical protein